MKKYSSAIVTNLMFFALNSIFFIIITPLALKVMGKEFYGIWVIILAVSTFSNIGTLNMTWVINKVASEKVPDQEQPSIYNQKIITSAFTILLPMAILCALVIIFQRQLITNTISVDPIWKQQFFTSLLFIALSLIPQFLAISLQGFLLANILNKLVRQIDTLINILLWGGVVVIAYFEKNIVIISQWYLIIQLINFTIYYFVVNKRFKIAFAFEKILIRKILTLAMFFVLQTIAINAYQQLDRIIIGINLGASDVAVYGIGTSIALRIVMVALQMASIMLPLASYIATTQNRNDLYLIFRKFSKVSNSLITIIGCILLIWISSILTIWLTPEFSYNFSLEFRILILSYIFWSIAQPAHQTLIGAGYIKFTTALYVITTVLFIIFIYFGSKQFGLLGGASANLIVFLLLGFNIYAYMKIPEKFSLRELIQDNLLWVLIPIIFTILMLITELLVVKILASVVLMTISLIWLVRDSTTKNYIIKIPGLNKFLLYCKIYQK